MLTGIIGAITDPSSMDVKAAQGDFGGIILTNSRLIEV